MLLRLVKLRLRTFELAGKPTYFPFGVAPDFMDARINVLGRMAQALFAKIRPTMREDHPQKADLLAKCAGPGRLAERKSRIF